MVANTHTRPTVLSQGTFLSVSADEFAEAAAIAGFDALNIWRHAPSFESASAVGMATRRAGLSVHAVCRGGISSNPTSGRRMTPACRLSTTPRNWVPTISSSSSAP